ncbi:MULTISPECIES: hypothetical protein [Robiginitalea]|uniref:Lipoprotein n=1 Tax=Robiginitalea biformata (strain ATCC BAA-864 / DSM 15991 / KCTC 12146 / HTCC2501) TaxID=313596 RepID=A4CJH7_ROBBH|nr:MULTISPECIES: hypothetical protein [Robiginitalea]EAR17085.1 hypothetical protein RB2501_09285 [Robiginitalea biformata HTCC2501]MDC6355656.1 hypothetical protein [Robiginitalea sp. PM2]MDC6376067.1 hypothetical protein [Robiginitalea sp. SP8]
MKSIRYGTLLALLAVAGACNLTEEIYLEPDGSGSIALSFDGSGMLEMAGEELLDSTSVAMDSVVYFSEILEEKKDSIATLPLAEQERLKSLEPYRLRMQSNPAAGEMLFTLERDFASLAEVEESFNAFQRAGSLDPEPNAGAMPGTPEIYESTRVSYRFGDRVFSRRSEITDSVLHRQRLDSLEGTAMFLSGSTYTLKIHFPSRIRSASSETATLSMDGKTLIQEVEFMEYLRDPGVLDIRVELEE